MSESHPTTRAGAGKPAANPNATPATPASTTPAKLYPEFPLFAHAAGVWAKKIRGKMCYFGPWDDPDGAFKKYNEQKEALHAGRKPRPDPEAVTMKDIANAFLHHKQALLDAGELTPRTWAEYKATTDLLVTHLGKGRLVTDIGPDDFGALRAKLAAKRSPTCLGNDIQRVRSVFKHAFNELQTRLAALWGQSAQQAPTRPEPSPSAPAALFPEVLTAEDWAELAAEREAGQQTPKKPKGKTSWDRFKVLSAFIDFTLRGLSRNEAAVWLVIYRDTMEGSARTSQADIARSGGRKSRPTSWTTWRRRRTC
jgi:hypothetical protein